MSPISSNTATPIDCFATATKLVIDASRIDPRCATVVPKLAVAYANMAKDPKSKASLGANMQPSIINADPPPLAITYLVEAIRVLSLAAPMFGTQVSNLIPLIISCMSPMEPSGFASAEVGAEISMVSGESGAKDTQQLESTEAQTQGTVVNIPSPSTSRKKKSHEMPTINEEDSPSQASLRGRAAPSQDESSLIVSKDAMNDHYTSDSTDTNISGHSSKSFNAAIGKRTERGDKRRNQASDRIPKRQKLPYKFHQPVLAPKVRVGEDSYASSTFLHTRGGFASAEDRNRAFSCTKPHYRDDIPLDVLLHRYTLWQRVLSYKPTTRCIPTDTYLVIVITSASLEDSPPLLKKYSQAEELKDKEFYAYMSIKKIVMIPRPLGGSHMYYCIPNLHKWLHGTLQLRCDQDVLFKLATKHIDDIVRIEPGRPFRDADLGIQVKYQDRLEWHVPEIRDLIPYVAHEMDPSSATARQVPCMSCGWSTANPNEYKNNRTNILGSISPFLSDGGMKYLAQGDRNKIVDLVCHLIKTFSPCGIHPTPFYHSDPKIKAMREDLARRFLQKLGETTSKNDEPFFLPEGIAFIFNNFVPFHVDQMNDTSAGMNETLAINCQCVIGYELSGIPSIKKAMNTFHLNVGDPLSFSMVIYSRKVVGDYVKKQLRITAITESLETKDKANLPDCWWLLKPLLKAIENVESEANTNALWDDPTLLDDYMDKTQCDDGSSQYRGKYSSLMMGYDKMRYWSPVKYLVDVLHAKKVITMTRDNLMGFICFAALETNGTFLLSAIIDELLSDDPDETVFMEEFKKYGLYAALIFAGQRKNKNVASGQAYGSSNKCRLRYHNRGTCDRFPIAGGKGLLSFEDDMKEKISQRCMHIVQSLGDECYRLHSTVKDIAAKNRKGCADSTARYFHSRVQELGGPGVSHGYALNFIHLASMFGLLPYDIVNWACVNHKSSGAYKAINAFYKKSLVCDSRSEAMDLTEEVADKHFKAAVKYIGSNVNWNFSAALAENVLCVLNMEMEIAELGWEESQPKKPDILYFYEHRDHAMHHMYRWKLDTPAKAQLQVLLISENNEVYGSYNLLEVTRDGSKEGSSVWGANWHGGPKKWVAGVTETDTYVLSADYAHYLV